MKQCEEIQPNDALDPAPAPTAQEPADEAEKDRGGGQKGNSNALSHGLFSKTRAAQRRKQRHRKRAEAEVQAILDELGLAGSATAQRIGRRLAQCEVEAAILEKFCEQRGRMDKHGELKAAYVRLLDVRNRDLGEARKLLDMQADQPATTGTLRFTVSLPTTGDDGDLCLGCGQPMPQRTPVLPAATGVTSTLSAEEQAQAEALAATVHADEKRRRLEQAESGVGLPQRPVDADPSPTDGAYPTPTTAPSTARESAPPQDTAAVDPSPASYGGKRRSRRPGNVKTMQF